MPIAPRDTLQLSELYDRFKDHHAGAHKEDFFAVLYATKKLRCSAEEVLERTNFASPEVGVDAYFFDRATKNLYLFVAVWSEDHNKLKEKMAALADHGMALLFGDAPGAAGPFVRAFQADLVENQAAVERVYVQCVFKGDAAKADQSSGLADRKERIEGRSHLAAKKLGRPWLEFRVEFVADRRSPAPPQPVDVHEIEFVEKATLETPDGKHVLHIGFIRLMDLFQIHKMLEARFFDRNIRFGLNPNNPPNRKIRESLHAIAVNKTETPELFAFHHNGVTLAAQQIDIVKGKVSLRAPRLLNGAQTVSSLRKFMEDLEETHVKPDLQALDRIRIIAKLVVGDPSSEFITGITISNNQQNPVEPWNLRANDRIQCDLADRFKDELGIYYERQENSMAALSDEELQEMEILDTDRSMTIKQLAQTFLASQGELVAMTHLPLVFEEQDQYEMAFKPRYLETDPRRIILSYKTGHMLNRVFVAMVERAPQWLEPAIKRSRNLVWALLVQGLLNARNLAEILETFGASLKLEHGFGDLLKELGAVRVLNVMKDVYSEPAYRKRIEAERYTFTKTKEVYQRCMQVAAERYQWTKRQL